MSSTLVHATKLVDGIQKCMDYFEKSCTNVEGVFRIPGLHKNVLLLEKYFESDKEVDIPNIIAAHPEISAHDVSAAFKSLLRSVKDRCGQPIVNFVCYKPLLDVCKANLSPKKTANKMAAILRALMIPAHTSLLKRLSLYFYDFASKAVATTKMDIRALATCVAPSIFMRPVGKRPDGATPEQFEQQCLMAEMNDMKDICQTYAVMITYSHQIFGQTKDKTQSRKKLPTRTQRSATMDFLDIPYTPEIVRTQKPFGCAASAGGEAAPAGTSNASPPAFNRRVPKTRNKDGEEDASAALAPPTEFNRRVRRYTDADQDDNLPVPDLSSVKISDE